MKKLLLLAALLAGGTLALNGSSYGHGGTYRGPGDTVPPGGGGGGGGAGPATPGPGGPSTPGPSTPGTPGPATPGAPPGAPGGQTAPTTGAVNTGPDLTLWDFWWGFNKEPYLNLRARIQSGTTVTGSDDFFLGRGQKDQAKDSLRPSEEQIRDIVVPALKRALEKERGNDILTGSMIALAKIGDVKSESGESEFEGIIKAFLKDGNQEVAETAAIALGILANEASIPTLVSLMKDEPDGRKLVGSTEVQFRTRAFAAYGLGLIGNRSSDNEKRQLIAEHLIDILEAPTFSTRDIKVAAITALGLTPIDMVEGDVEISEEESKSNFQHCVSREAQLLFLQGYFDEANQRANKDNRHWFVRAHAPMAMARLMEGEASTKLPERRQEIVELLLEGCGKHSKLQMELQQSCVLALGQIGTAGEGDAFKDETIRKELERLVKDGEQQARRFAVIALGQVGSRMGLEEDKDQWAGREPVGKKLVDIMSKGKTQMKPWAAMALGVYGRALLDADLALNASQSLALRAATTKERTPSDAGAYMVGLGLRRDVEAADILVEKLDYFSGSDDTRGYAAVGLGLMEARDHIGTIQEVVRSSEYRPDLLKQAAIALGLLGDKDLVPELIEMLKNAKGLATQAAISSALGAIGDRRSIDPLVGMLGDDSITQTARGFSAVALGIVCDKELFPWNTKISVNCNYRANTVTLTGESGTGILDIL